MSCVHEFESAKGNKKVPYSNEIMMLFIFVLIVWVES